MVVVAVAGREVVGAIVDVKGVGTVTFGPAVLVVCSTVVSVGLGCDCATGIVVEAGSLSRAGG